MSISWEHELELIREEERSYGAELNKGASELEIKRFNSFSMNMLGYVFPSEYLNVLRKINGLNYNGLYLYGIDASLLQSEPNRKVYSAVENNLDWYSVEEQKKYIFFAHDSISWYVQDRENKQFELLDLPSGSRIEIFESFNDLMKKMLKTSLQ